VLVEIKEKIFFGNFVAVKKRKPEAGYVKKLFLIDQYQRKIPTDSGK